MRTPLQARSESSADRMLDAALTLLADGGLRAVTVAAVAREAGTSNGSLYHRFGDRGGLLLAAQDRALGQIEAATARAFARADAEPDDDRALAMLAREALAIFGTHRAALRTFLVEAAGQPEFEARTVRSSHLLATTVTDWLRTRFDARDEDAEAAYRLLFALGAAQALFDDAQVSPGRTDPDRFADAVARAVGAVVRA
ncbi:TetR/AcrR family transcriptional regulator [Nocardioides sp. zg-DK7169]|uniref:TetR/AcrR family transcriptional regulator n=1 Tax=Nocardioides sp. zg-DK7169 TaxID=2736600 RepID=UPI001554CE03|nr:TetR/AcrR family transcriptional regulator [Nocardioides sp. zg-DK7169]NPC97904.1 TetR/AcrR family transcriptional regulator [Nocardioides sp. zg-DK7169]